MPFWSRKRNGITFIFKSDPLDDTMAHIYARHRKTEAQAMAVWFGFVEERWNEARQRFESYTETEGLYWKWHDKDTDQTLVLIISCFDRRDRD